MGKPEGKKPLGRPRHRWEDNIKMDLQEVGYGQVEGKCECVNGNVDSIKCGEFD